MAPVRQEAVLRYYSASGQGSKILELLVFSEKIFHKLPRSWIFYIMDLLDLEEQKTVLSELKEETDLFLNSTCLPVSLNKTTYYESRLDAFQLKLSQKQAELKELIEFADHQQLANESQKLKNRFKIAFPQLIHEVSESQVEKFQHVEEVLEDSKVEVLKSYKISKEDLQKGQEWIELWGEDSKSDKDKLYLVYYFFHIGEFELAYEVFVKWPHLIQKNPGLYFECLYETRRYFLGLDQLNKLNIAPLSLEEKKDLKYYKILFLKGVGNIEEHQIELEKFREIDKSYRNLEFKIRKMHS